MKRTDDINVLRKNVSDLLKAYEAVERSTGADNLGGSFHLDYLAIDDIDCICTPYEDENDERNSWVTMDSALDAAANCMNYYLRDKEMRSWYEDEDRLLQDAKLAVRIYRFLKKSVDLGYINSHPRLKENYSKAIAIIRNIESEENK